MELEVKLSKNSWHYKLQKFVFKSDTPDLHSLCPYFWLTIFCLPASIFVMIYRPIKYVVVSFLNYLEKREDSRVDKILKNLTLESAIEIVNKKKKMKGTRWDLWSLVYGWSTRNNISEEDREKFFQKLLEERNKNEDTVNKIRVEKKAKKEEFKQKVQVAKIVKYTKFFVGVIISLFIALLIYVGVVKLINADWSHIGEKLVHALIVLGLFALIAIFIIFVVIAFNNVEKYYKKEDNLSWYGYPFYWIFNIIKWPFIGLWEVFKFFFSYFSAAKDNYCPGIIWEDSEKVNK